MPAALTPSNVQVQAEIVRLVDTAAKAARKGQEVKAGLALDRAKALAEKLNRAGFAVTVPAI